MLYTRDMKLISWFLTLLVLFVALIFALHNGQKAAINLWPFDVEAEMPFYIFPLGMLFVGFLTGALVGWISHIPHRMEARRLRRDLAGAHKKLEEMRNNMPFTAKNKGRDYINWAKSRWRWRSKRT